MLELVDRLVSDTSGYHAHGSSSLPIRTKVVAAMVEWQTRTFEGRVRQSRGSSTLPGGTIKKEITEGWPSPVEGYRLENGRGLKNLRGFESHPFRHYHRYHGQVAESGLRHPVGSRERRKKPPVVRIHSCPPYLRRSDGMADVLASKASGLWLMRVRLPPPVPFCKNRTSEDCSVVQKCFTRQYPNG